MKQLRATVRGKVQGVCFRAHTQRQAMQPGLNGDALNLPDGELQSFEVRA